jgi:hypothetical protein
MSNFIKIILIFIILQFGFVSICFSEDYTQKLINIGKKRASDSGYNLIAFSKDNNGIHLEYGNVSWGSNGIVFQENDMVLNAGNVPLKFRGFDLSPGQFITMTNGSFNKSKETLRPK